MPDAKGILTHEERVRVAHFVNEKASTEGDPCLVCGSVDTRVGHALLFIPAGSIEGGLDLGSAQPVLPIICHNCGFVRHFHAERLGLVPPTIPPEEE